MQSRTGDSLHRAQGEGRGEGRLGRATAYTDKHNTMALTCGGPGWRVVARYKLTCYHAHFARSTAGCTHNWSPQGDNVGNREREGGGGRSQGDCECDTHTDTGGRNAPPHSRRFPHNTWLPHMLSRTGHSLHRAQGRWQEREGALDVQPPTQINTMALTSAGPGWRAVARFKLTCYHAHFTRSTAGCTHTWSPQGDNAGNRERGGEGGGGHS
jgi:hypothetical protein